MNIFKKLSFYIDYHMKKFECIPASSNQESKEILNKVFIDELNRVEELEMDDLQNEAIDLICRERKSQQAVGVIQMYIAASILGRPTFENLYDISAIPKHLLHKILVVDLMAVLPSYRQTFANTVMFLAIAEYCFQNKIEVILMACEPGLLSYYAKFEMHPYRKIKKTAYGYLIPCAMAIYQASKKVNVYHGLESKYILTETTLSHQDINYFNGLDIDLGFTKTDTNFIENFTHPLFDNLSKNGKIQILKNAIILNPDLNDIVIRDGDGNISIGIILEGKLTVVYQLENLIELSKDDIFGEFSFINNCARTADLRVSTNNTKILILRRSLIKQLKSPSDVAAFWKNLAMTLVAKLLKNSNRIVSIHKLFY